MKAISIVSAIIVSTLSAFAGEVKVEVTGNDQMQYNVKNIDAAAGDKLVITFKNIGKLPKEAMSHNLVVLKPGTAPAAVGAKAMTAKATDYIPQDAETKALIVVSSKLLGPGESDTITFDAKEAGVYPFVCTFPGHFGIMNGTITVK